MRPLDWIAAANVAQGAATLVKQTVQGTGESFSQLLSHLSGEQSPVRDASAELSPREQLVQELEKLLQQAGIRLDQVVAVSYSDTAGEFQVSGEHPQKELIEAVLNSDREFARRANEIVAAQRDDPTRQISEFAPPDIWSFELGRERDRSQLAQCATCELGIPAATSD